MENISAAIYQMSYEVLNIISSQLIIQLFISGRMNYNAGCYLCVSILLVIDITPIGSDVKECSEFL
jgi:hypothetical protein